MSDTSTPEFPTIDPAVTAGEVTSFVERAVPMALLGGLVVLAAAAVFIGGHLLTIATREGVGRSVREHGTAWITGILLATAAAVLAIGLREMGIWFDSV